MDKELCKFIIEKLLSWPVMVMAICLIFRRGINNVLLCIHGLLGRDNVKVELAKWVTIDSSTAQAQLENKAAEKGLAIASADLAPEIQSFREGIKKVAIYPGVPERAQVIQDEIVKLGFTEKEAIETLGAHLAFTQMQVLAERTYRLIFGSQITLLKQINVRGPQPEEALRQYYEQIKGKYPEFYDSYSFESYLKFMVGQNLIVQSENQYIIKNEGKEFLRWLTDAGVSEDKAF